MKSKILKYLLIIILSPIWLPMAIGIIAVWLIFAAIYVCLETIYRIAEKYHFIDT